MDEIKAMINKLAQSMTAEFASVNEKLDRCEAILKQLCADSENCDPIPPPKPESEGK